MQNFIENSPTQLPSSPVKSAAIVPGERQEAPLNTLENFYYTEVEKFLAVKNPFILDLGCGGQSIFSSTYFAKQKIIAVDRDEGLIARAPKDHVTYYCMNVGEIIWQNRFDLALDSHLFHCLTETDERESFLFNIHRSLRPGAIFALETMAAHKGMKFSSDYYYAANKTLYQQSTMRPLRKILSAWEIEQSLLKYFDLLVFKIFVDNKFLLQGNGQEFLATEPDVLRIVCVKKSE